MESAQIPARIKLARQQRGLSRRDVASRLNVDVTAVAAWETGRYLPRDAHRAALARLLEVDLSALLSQDPANAALGVSASIVHGTRQGRVLAELTESCRGQLTIIRVASPFATIRHQMRDFREIAARRILNGSLEVLVIEVFYSLQRLQEVLSNVFRYDGCRYLVKTFPVPRGNVFPGVDTYVFDNAVSILSSYWTTSVIDERPVIQVAGEPFTTFVREHWNEIWRRAVSLNPAGAQDLSALREIAVELGVPNGEWDRFVEQSKAFSVGDDVLPSP